MNVNIKLSLTDRERNLLKRKMVGKDVKALATRADVNQMVNGFMQSMLEDVEAERANGVGIPRSMQPSGSIQQFDQSKVPEQYRDKPLAWQMGWYRGRYVNKPFRV